MHNIFSEFNVSDEEFITITAGFDNKSFAPGDIVFNQGDASDNIYIIQSGELIFVSRDNADNESVLDVLGPGNFFGEVGVLNNVPRTATVRALTHVQLRQINKENFFKLRAANTQFSQFIDQLCIDRQIALIPAFNKLADTDIAKLRGAFYKQTVAAGDVLCRQGEAADRIFLLSKGRAEFERVDAEGMVNLSGDVKAIAYFGEEAFFNRKNYIAQLTMTEAGEVWILKRAALKALVKENPAIAAALPLKSFFLSALSSFLYCKSAWFSIPFFAMNHPRMVLKGVLFLLFILLLPAILPSIWPAHFTYLNGLQIDTDPANLLAQEEPARVIHRRIKAEMNIHDLMVVGIVNEQHPDGIFNPESLQRINELAQFAAQQHWFNSQKNKMEGVIATDIMAPSTVEIIRRNDSGKVIYAPLMTHLPTTQAEALALREKIKHSPILNTALASQDGKAIALYLPLSSKDVSYRVYNAMQDKIAEFEGEDHYYISGLPVAEDYFGVEMFAQMALSVPLALLLIFFLMYLFFRNLVLISVALIVAVLAVIYTLSLLVISGQTVHIMSSMIPIFILPVAVLDSIHILSEFFDYYPRIKSRRLTMEHVIRGLFVPMLFTTITTAVGFASLALVPIPPIQVFGIFVSIGVILAWLLSMSFIPAYIFLVPKEKIEALALAAQKNSAVRGASSALSLQSVRKNALKYSQAIIVVSLLISVVFLYGISRIQINDNPVRWFHQDHQLRIADRALNKHFSGTYMAYIAFNAEPGDADEFLTQWQQKLSDLLIKYPDSSTVVRQLQQIGNPIVPKSDLLGQFSSIVSTQLHSSGLSEQEKALYTELLSYLDKTQVDYELFKQPQLLDYLARLQHYLLTLDVVGQTTSVVDLTAIIDDPVTADRAQLNNILLSYANSQHPQDLWRFVTPDFRQGIIWLKLNSGDNVDMIKVIQATERFIADNSAPFELNLNWLGLNYMNVIWQEKMVTGMMHSILGSYLAIFLIMILLLRSFWWALLAMLPLNLTLLVIYGVLGLSGKSYDMPVAVLSALSIGLAVDFSIHIILRTRHFYYQTGDWQQALKVYFNEPARAISRNMFVVALGFLPLLLSPLVPYNTVGYLIAAILFSSGIAALVIIPALIKPVNAVLFSRSDSKYSSVLSRVDILSAGVIAALLAFLSVDSFFPFSAETWLWYLAALLVIALVAIKSCLFVK